MIDEFRVEGILATSFLFRLSEADQGYKLCIEVKGGTRLQTDEL